jgi:hypothetical protein
MVSTGICGRGGISLTAARDSGGWVAEGRRATDDWSHLGLLIYLDGSEGGREVR